MKESVGSDTETICAVSMCWSTVSSERSRPATSVQISVSWASSRSKKCRPSAWSMSVMRRSLTPPSIDPPSSNSIAPSSSVLSVESSIRVPIGSTLKIAAVEFAGTAPCAFAHVSWVDVRTSISSGTRSSADRRVEAVRQKASSVRCSRRVCSAVNLVGRVKSTARMRRRRCGRGLLLGQPALTGRVHKGRDRVRAEDRAAHATSLGEHAVGAAGLAHGHLACAHEDADRAAAVAAGLGRHDRDPGGGELVAYGGLVALADLEGS